MTNPKFWRSSLFLATLIGCAGEQAPAPSETPKAPASEIKTSPKTEPKHEDPKAVEAPKVEGPKADAKPAKLTADEIAEIKKLPADDAALALKQAVCPASDENLGGMGMPVKVTAEGKTFFLCCKSCEKEVKADPKAIIAKLAK